MITIRNSSFLLTVMLLLTFTSFAQKDGEIVARGKSFDVQVSNGSYLNVKSANLSTTVIKSDGQLTEYFELSFEVPIDSLPLFENTKTVLTALTERGGIYGKYILFGLQKSDYVENGKTVKVSLEVGADFAKADTFTLEIVPMTEQEISCVTNNVTCAECVGMANDTCGRGKVQSVACGKTRDGSCEFTCKP